MRICKKCLAEKGLGEFNKSGSEYGDGLRSYCRQCQSAYHRSESGKKASKKYRISEKGRASGARAKARYRKTDSGVAVEKRWKEENRGKIRLISRRCYAKNPEKYREQERLYRERYPERKNAQMKAWRAYPKKVPCVICLSDGVHRHHRDYSKPLEIVWLCASCHKLLHLELKCAS